MSNQNLGTLFVRLNADSKAFLKGMAGAAASVEKFAKETKKLANEVAQVSGTLLAIGGAAVKLAATVDRGAARSMAKLEASTRLLAVQVYDVLRPAVDSLTASFKTAAAYIAGLDPETRKQIATWAVYAAQLAVAAKALGMLAGLADGALGAVKAFAGALSAIGIGGLLGVVAALAAVLALVIVVHRAWRKNWGGIQEIVETVINGLGDAVKFIASVFKRFWDAQIDGAVRLATAVLDVVDMFAKISGKGSITGGMREGLAGLAKDLKSGDFFVQAFQFAKSVATQAKDVAIEELRLIGEEIRSGLNIGSFSKGTARAPSGTGPLSSGPQISGAVMTGPRGINMGSDFLRNMDQLARETASASVQLELARKREIAQRDAIAKAIEHEAKLAQARATGNLKGLSRGERRSVRADTGGAWGSLNAAQKNIANFAKRVSGMVTGALGEVGQVMNNIAEGAKAGGVWGAIIAAVLEVFQRMQSFQKMLRILTYGLTRLGQFLEPLLGPIFDIVGQLVAMGTEQLAPLFKALQPLFDAIVGAMKQLLPTIAPLGKIFSALAPVVEALGKFVNVLFNALGPLFQIGIVSMKVFATSLLGFLIMLNEIAAAFGDAAARAEADRLKKMVDEMWAPAADELAMAEGAAAAAAWDNASAQEEAASSARAVTESLTNVPSGYKVNAARFNATNPYAGASADGGGGNVSVGEVNINVDSAISPEDLAAMIAAFQTRDFGTKKGNPASEVDRRRGKDW